MSRLLFAAARGARIQWWHDSWKGPANSLSGMLETPDDYRIKPKTRSITVDGVLYEWPEPMRVAPKHETKFWFAGSTQVWAASWSNGASDYGILNTGFAHATKEGAEAHRRALVAVSGGTLE